MWPLGWYTMSRKNSLINTGRRRFLTAVGSAPLLTKLLPSTEGAPDGTEYNPKTEKARLHGWTHTNYTESTSRAVRRGKSLIIILTSVETRLKHTTLR